MTAGAEVHRVFVPSQLRDYTSGAHQVTARGDTLAELFADLDARFPGFKFRVIDEQERVRQHIVLFVGEERSEALGAPLPPGVDVHVVGALSGG